MMTLNVYVGTYCTYLWTDSPIENRFRFMRILRESNRVVDAFQTLRTKSGPSRG